MSFKLNTDVVLKRKNEFDQQGKYLQKSNKLKNQAFVREIEKNADVLSLVDDICCVDAESVKRKLAQQVEQQKARQVELLIIANHPDFAPLMKNYCNKTGRFLYGVSLEQLQRIIDIKGKEKALEVLRINAVQKVSLEWLYTDPDTLNMLMINDCAGYFIYASGLIFHHDYIMKSAEGVKAPDNKTEQIDSVFDSLVDFTDIYPVNSISAMQFYQLPITDKNRYIHLQDKIQAAQNLEVLDNKELIIKANELIRRLIGLANEQTIAKLGIFSDCKLVNITQSSSTLVCFIAELQACLKTVFIEFFRGMHYTKAEFVINKLRNREITAANIAAIKAQFKGKSNFHKQPKIKNLTKRQKQEQAILHDFMNFWDEQPETTPSNQSIEETKQVDELINFVFNPENTKQSLIQAKPKPNRFTVSSDKLTNFKLKF